MASSEDLIKCRDALKSAKQEHLDAAEAHKQSSQLKARLSPKGKSSYSGGYSSGYSQRDYEDRIEDHQLAIKRMKPRERKAYEEARQAKCDAERHETNSLGRLMNAQKEWVAIGLE
jgi:hypothetical protein